GSAEITRRLFAILDTNKDGKLDAKELAAAERVLLRFDDNEDELVSLDEVMGDEGGERLLVAERAEFQLLPRLAGGRGAPDVSVAVDVRHGRGGAMRVRATALPGARRGIQVRNDDGQAVLKVGAVELVLGPGAIAGALARWNHVDEASIKAQLKAA